jgi:hypothetical protein
MIFALIFETCLAVTLCYTPGLDKGLNMYPLKLVTLLCQSLFFLLLLLLLLLIF